MKYSKEVKTALLAIVAVVLLIFGYSFLKGNNLLDSSRTFHSVYEDVEGLSPSSPVTINGLRVGNVSKIDFLDQTGTLVVTFTVDTDFQFSKNSTAQIYGGGLIGGKSIAIIPEYEPGNLAKSGDTLPGEIEEGLMEIVNNRLGPLQEKIEQTIVSTDSLVTAFNEILNEESRNNIKQSFEDISLTVASLKNSAQSINGILDENSGKLNRTFTNLDEMSANLNAISDTLSQVEFNRMVNDLQKVVSDFEGITEKINNGEGTASRLINDPSIYINLERATRQMNQLIQDIKLNPRRYVHFSVFGRNSAPYSPPRDSLN